MPKSFLVKKKRQGIIEKEPNTVEFRQLILSNPGDLWTAGSLVNPSPNKGGMLSLAPSTSRNNSTFSHLLINKDEDDEDEKLDIKFTTLYESGAQETLYDSRGHVSQSHIKAADGHELKMETPHSEEALLRDYSLAASSLDSHDDRCYNSNADAACLVSSSGAPLPETIHFRSSESRAAITVDQRSAVSSNAVVSDDFQLTDFIEFAETCILGTPCNSPGSASVMTDSSNSEAASVTHGVMTSLVTGKRNSPQDVEQTDDKKYRYTCDVCFKSFSRSNTLTTHKRIHTGDKPFECDQCGRAFRQPGNLTRHRLTHTTVKPYVCPQCKKAFNRASNLHTHMRTHTNYKPFVCDFCGKGFHQKIDMKIHRYTHTGEKPHKCQKCGRGFKQLTHLTYHMRTHSDVRMYECEYCGKGFNQKGNLQAHIYGHTGQRPYKCDVCGKGFTLASTLNTHKRTHAPKKPFKCQLCDKAFYQKNALKTHYIASHPFANGISLL